MMKKLRTLKIIATLLAFISNVNADTINIEPTEEEALNNPIHLKCGAVITEWRGTDKPSRDSMKSLVEKLCSFTEERFHNFVHEQGYKTSPDRFSYSISLIPGGKEYRELNDTKYRFSSRKSDNVTGYTTHYPRYIFNISNVKDPDFAVSMVHEMFHAMSFHYGVYAQHKGSVSDKNSRDEYLAYKFTEKYTGQR